MNTLMSNTVNSTNMSLKQSVKIYWLETKFEWLKTIRNPSFALPALLFPVLFYLFFGVLLNQNDAKAASYLLCTYGTFGVMGPALFSFGAALAVEKGKGWLDIKEASPMPASAQIISRLIVSMLFSGLIILSLGLAATTIANVNLSLVQWIQFSVILVLGGLPFCLLGLILGLLLKAESAPAIVNIIYLPMSFLSGLWLPLAFLPVSIQSLAEFLPSYHLSQLALKVTGQDAGGSIVKHLTVLALFGIISFTLATMIYYRRQK